MNKRIMQILCFIMLLFMAGCGSPSADAPDVDALVTMKETDTKVYEQLEEKSGTFSALDDNGKLPEKGSLGGFRYQIGAYEEYDTKFKDWGYYRYENDARAPWVIEICSGEHSTGGYKIRIVNVEADEAGKLCVTIEETAPDPKAMVTEAFTFPKVTLLIYEETKMPSSVTVKTTGGTELPFLGSMPPKSETDEEDTAWQGEKVSEKVVIAPPEGAYLSPLPGVPHILHSSQNKP